MAVSNAARRLGAARRSGCGMTLPLPIAAGLAVLAFLGLIGIIDVLFFHGQIGVQIAVGLGLR